MQQIVFQRKFSGLLDAVKTEILKHLEEMIQPIKNIVIEKSQEKISSNLNFKKSRLIFEKISSRCSYSIYLGYRLTKFDIDRTSRLGVSLYTDRFINSLFY